MRAAEFLRALVTMLDSMEEEPAQKQPPIVVNVNNGGANASQPAPDADEEPTTDKFVPPLQQKIELLKNDYEIYLVEWVDCTGGVLVVTRNKIANLVAPERFYTLNEDKQQLIEIINKKNKDLKVKPDAVKMNISLFVIMVMASLIYILSNHYNNLLYIPKIFQMNFHLIFLIQTHLNLLNHNY